MLSLDGFESNFSEFMYRKSDISKKLIQTSATLYLLNLIITSGSHKCFHHFYDPLSISSCGVISGVHHYDLPLGDANFYVHISQTYGFMIAEDACILFSTGRYAFPSLFYSYAFCFNLLGTTSSLFQSLHTNIY